MFLIVGIGGIEVLLLFLLFIILPIAALIDVLTGKFEGNNKLVWVLVILLVPFLGSIFYFIIGRRKRIKG